MKHIYALLILFLGTVNIVNAQDADSATKLVDEIKNNKDYIYGEGKAETIIKADRYALDNVISQISISVLSDVEATTTEHSSDNQSTVDADFKSTIKTYSNATLANTQQIIIENEPNAHVFRYILRKDIDRIFESRKLKAINMIEEAQHSLYSGKINDALRYYYWAHSLIKSLRFPNEVYIRDEDGEKQMANIWIPKKINSIFSELKISVKEKNEDNVRLEISYKGKKIDSIDFSYFDGRGWSNIYSAQDGIGVVELRKEIQINNIQLKIEYIFENEAVIDPEIKEILSVASNATYKAAYINISLDNIEEKSAEVEVNLSSGKSTKTETLETNKELSFESLTEVEETEPY